MKKIILIILAGLFCSTAYGAEVVIFEGIPLVRNLSSVNSTANQKMSKTEQRGYKVIITKKDGEYIWLSQERRALKYRTNRVYHFFVADRGDYIRIAPNPEGGYLYMEHLTDGFNIITHWGVGDKFEP